MPELCPKPSQKVTFLYMSLHMNPFNHAESSHEIKFSNGSVGDCPDKSDAINMTKSASLAYL